jgi:hypothetical protein
LGALWRGTSVTRVLMVLDFSPSAVTLIVLIISVELALER